MKTHKNASVNKRAALLKQALFLVESEKSFSDYRLSQAQALVAQLRKEGTLWDWLKNPVVSTIMSLLSPLIGKSYKVKQAVELLLSALREAS